MSHNINIVAKGEAIFPNGKTYPVEDVFNCLPTPTKVTQEIERSDDPIESYIAYLSKNIEQFDTEEDVYDYSTWDNKIDYFKVSGKKIVNYRKDFIKELRAWISIVEEKGLTIEVYGT